MLFGGKFCCFFICYQFSTVPTFKQFFLKILSKHLPLLNFLLALSSINHTIVINSQAYIRYFLLIVRMWTSCHHWIKLRNNGCALGQGTIFSSGELVQKMTKGIIMLFFSRYLLNRKLEFTLHTTHKQVVNYNVASRSI